MPRSERARPERLRPVTARPTPMTRVAVAVPPARTRDALVLLARAGAVELDEPALNGSPEGPATAALHRVGGAIADPRVAPTAPDVDALIAAHRTDLLTGEAQLERMAAGSVQRDGVRVWAGWCPADREEALAAMLSEVDSAIVPLRRPPGVDPPTLLREDTPLRESFAPLVRTYGTVPYADLDPTLFSGLAYVLMFGMMFADAGHGLVLLLAALLLRFAPRRFRDRLRPMWPFVAGAGLASAVAGFAFGEFFGPTGVLPVRWLSPLDEPVRLLGAGIGLGAALLAVAYLVGTINRWREGGAKLALYAPTGIAGAALYLGLVASAAGLYLGRWSIAGTGATVAAVALALCAIGLYAASGGGGAGAAQAAVQLFDLVLRIGANVVSFARLAAFGLTHAALGALVWSATTALWHRGGAAVLASVLVFVLGNALTFGLEALVAAIQALRLEYYELFSRVFEGEGRPFRPWTLSVKEASE
ncbi:V-type ATPase 116kDa subunit family protein [Actinoplanes solisilvae]|uniref:V-type ATPase 116kDa subunit family protein n=1 Tax=Actinoplanes solisilvae TaxID=2486853 RepID=UPI000FDAD2FE|nr:V-type ATPase 116kDa subunit family protein [Actinoplanes solisilvae]